MRRRPDYARTLVGMLLTLAVACEAPRGSLRITIVDSETNEPAPARVSIVDDRGRAWIAGDALPVRADCGESWPTRNQAVGALEDPRSVWNPYTETVEFYSNGTASADLPPGTYHVTVEKGPEYTSRAEVVQVGPSGSQQIRIDLERWTDMRERGWLSSDGHLHITRAVPDDDDVIAQWMQAESIDIANLLQMGTPTGVRAAPQRMFGPASLFQSNGVGIVSGQENPRTTNLGHMIVLGADRYIAFRMSTWSTVMSSERPQRPAVAPATLTSARWAIETASPSTCPRASSTFSRSSSCGCSRRRCCMRSGTSGYS